MRELFAPMAMGMKHRYLAVTVVSIRQIHSELASLTGSRPMKKDHPGVQPEAEGSKKPRAYDAGRLPAAALIDRDMSMALYVFKERV